MKKFLIPGALCALIFSGVSAMEESEESGQTTEEESVEIEPEAESVDVGAQTELAMVQEEQEAVAEDTKLDGSLETIAIKIAAVKDPATKAAFSSIYAYLQTMQDFRHRRHGGHGHWKQGEGKGGRGKREGSSHRKHEGKNEDGPKHRGYGHKKH